MHARRRGYSPAPPPRGISAGELSAGSSPAACSLPFAAVLSKVAVAAPVESAHSQPVHVIPCVRKPAQVEASHVPPRS